MVRRFPQPITLLLICVAVAAVLTWVLPAGRYDRRDDPATGRSVVVAGTYHAVEPTPVRPFDALVSVPRGMADASAVVFYVFLVGGAFGVVEKTGALTRLVHWLVTRLAGRRTLVIPVACVVFGMGGVLIQMQEELLAFVPMLLLLTRRLGFSALTAVAMSLGAAAVGAAFSPINPFQVVIAQKVAELQPQSGFGFRVAVLVPAMLIWIWGTVRYARHTAVAPEAVSLEPTDTRRRDGLILGLVALTFVLFVVGALRLGWDFEQFGALFLLMGILAGLIGGLGLDGTVVSLGEGFRTMTLAALLIGIARAIFVVLNQGQVIDTIVSDLFAPVSSLPVSLSAVAMMAMHTVLHVPVPSTSGQAVLTMPVLVPLSDLLGLSRQVTVLAYQYGAGLCELLTPTNGALMAMLAACGVPYDQWLRFMARLWVLLAGLGVAGLVAAIATGLR
jgi:uncharacterized ion transporter superfamily protein YfcC